MVNTDVARRMNEATMSRSELRSHGEGRSSVPPDWVAPTLPRTVIGRNQIWLVAAVDSFLLLTFAFGAP
ncbi:hypothetical protein ACQP2F_24195 [Actinoplanes sp. CA-030573]|uniref:hypothetical protein n=1 Tax=Actinoplanes sp. CA-030573 TaxID=3239898 RepID=UPI003D8B9C59